jgi:hypothetical protein
MYLNMSNKIKIQHNLLIYQQLLILMNPQFNLEWNKP